jgi:hypothetical protein
VTRDKGTDESAAPSGAEKKLIADLTADKVAKVSVAPASGDKFTLQKTGANWNLIEPVSAPAENFEVDSLVRAIADAQTRGAINGADAASDSTGLASPAFHVELTTSEGKNHAINVGAKSAVGGNVYVSLGDAKDVYVVPVALAEQLEKPAKDYRKTQLVSDVSAAQVKQLKVTDKDGKVTLRAEKQGEEWQIIEPAKMPAEKSEIDDMLFAVTGLRAIEFVSESAADAPKYQLDKPQLTVALSTDAPATQPATAPAATQAAPRTILFGRHDDVLRQNVYASVSGSPSIAKVAATALTSFNKKPLEMRDKRAVNIDPEQVSKLSFASDVAATTQPTSKPASKRDVSIQRRKQVELTLGPVRVPTSGPATTQSTTQAQTQPTSQPATQPANLSKWELLSDPKGEASDTKVDAILTGLHPLKVVKYLDAVPTTQAKPVATYTINVTTEGAGGANVAEHQIRLTDRGNDQPLLGEYNGLTFELDRAILRRLEGEFTKGAAASAAPAIPAGGNEETPFPLGQ